MRISDWSSDVCSSDLLGKVNQEWKVMELNAQTVERVHQRMDYERSRNAPPEDFPKLPDIPGVRYTDPDFLKLERESMWQRAWLYAGLVDKIPNPETGRASGRERGGQSV